jgi:hypothetical protein
MCLNESTKGYLDMEKEDIEQDSIKDVLIPALKVL